MGRLLTHLVPVWYIHKKIICSSI